MTDREIAEAKHRDAKRLATEQLARIHDMLGDYQKKLALRCAEINHPAATTAASSVMAYAINDIENLIRNFNFARLAECAADLRETTVLLDQS